MIYVAPDLRKKWRAVYLRGAILGVFLINSVYLLLRAW